MARILLLLVSILVAASALSGLSACGQSAPVPDFSASVTGGAAPLSVQFSDLSTGEVSAWAWDFNEDNQVDTTTQNPQYTYRVPGRYTVTLRVTGQGGTAVVTKDALIIVLPSAYADSTISPNTGRRGETVDVVLTGTSVTETTALSLGSDVIINNTTIDSPTQLTASISIGADADPGPRDVAITTPASSTEDPLDPSNTTGVDISPSDQTANIDIVIPRGFTVVELDKPLVTGVIPASAGLAAALDIVITGAQFDLVTDVTLGEGITVNRFTVDSPNQISASIIVASSTPATTRQVTVRNASGNGTLAAAFEVTVPSSPLVIATSPAFGSLGQYVDVLIQGDNFWGTSAITFRSGTRVTVDSFTIDSKTQLTANIYIDATATLGPRDISVTTPGGTATLVRAFEVIGVTPSSGGRGHALSVAITGEDLEETRAVSFGEGVSVSSFIVNSPTLLTASVAITSSANPGPREISIVTAAGVERVIGSFTVSLPSTTAAFSADKNTGKGTTTVNFTDLSTGEVTNWAWDLNGDGKIDSTAQNPSYTYDKDGSYTVTLTVSGPYSEGTLTKPRCIKITGCNT